MEYQHKFKDMPTADTLCCKSHEHLGGGGGGGGAQLVEHPPSGKEVTGSISTVAACSLLVVSVSV